MGPIWGRQDPGGRHVGHMNFAIWDWQWNGWVCHVYAGVALKIQYLYLTDPEGIPTVCWSSSRIQRATVCYTSFQLSTFASRVGSQQLNLPTATWCNNNVNMTSKQFEPPHDMSGRLLPGGLTRPHTVHRMLVRKFTINTLSLLGHHDTSHSLLAPSPHSSIRGTPLPVPV